MYKNCQTRLLRTDGPSFLTKQNNGNIVLLPENIKRVWDSALFAYINHHLHITSDEEIQKDNYCILVNRFGRQRLCQNLRPGCFRLFGERELLPGQSRTTRGDKFYKIISSTDESLGLPRPSNSFLKAYENKNGKGFENVLVEYEESFTSNELGIDWSDVTYKPKVALDNTITIKKVKTNFTTEEVEALCTKAFNDGWDNGVKTTKYMPTIQATDWTKENL